MPGHKIERYCEKIVTFSAANRTLDRFHALRKREVASGQRPTVRESLAKLHE
jgi:hypothetical protein